MVKWKEGKAQPAINGMLALFDFAFEITEKFSFSFGTVVNRISNFLKETISPGARCCRI